MDELSAAPLVSAVVLAYNASRFLPDCLASIEKQAYRNLEIIVVDDGSADNTFEVAGELSAADDRVWVLSQKSQYAGFARNNGLA